MFRRAHLAIEEVEPFNLAVSFLEGRLSERTTVEWALRQGPKERTQRLAVLFVLDHPRSRELKEPWLSTWRYIEEAWGNENADEDLSHLEYDIASRIKSGEASGSLISLIVRRVRPHLNVGPLSKIDLSIRKVPKKPRNVRDLLSLGITSGRVLNPDDLGLRKVTAAGFLEELAHELEACVAKGVDICVRIGWDKWFFSEVRRVYYVGAEQRESREHEADEYRDGIAPAAKLLHAAVEQLATQSRSSAQAFVRRWKQSRTNPIFVRLWASFARNEQLEPIAEVSDFLRTSDDREFWNVHTFPEIAEMRALRFRELPHDQQYEIVKRLMGGAPRAFWPRGADPSAVERGRRYWGARELRRIQVAGGEIPPIGTAWLKQQATEFPELLKMKHVWEGFLGGVRSYSVQTNPDDRFDMLDGDERLSKLEAALSSTKQTHENDPAAQARAWIGKAGNPDKLARDLATASDPSKYPEVWSQFGWQHQPPATNAAWSSVLEQVLTHIEMISSETARLSIQGLAFWFSKWAAFMPSRPLRFRVWKRLWAFAAEATNAQQPHGEPSLNIVVRQEHGSDPQDLDTLNTAAGRMVGAFLAFCPKLRRGSRPFKAGSLRAIRETIIKEKGRSGLIAKHRLLEHLGYFLLADKDWTRRHLIEPLLRESSEAAILRRAVARHVHYTDVLTELGEHFVRWTLDDRLGRDYRKNLAFSLIAEVLRSLHERRKPVVELTHIQQMLRAIEDELRAHVANIPQQFMREISGKEGDVYARRGKLFTSTVKPFLEKVWPQERSLSTPGVARAYADLPATSGPAFVQAVIAVERFMVPFDCWSLLDFGLDGEEFGKEKLEVVRDEPSGRALLALLDASIGNAEGAIVPYDLDKALERIRFVANRLSGTPQFRRLAALTRK